MWQQDSIAELLVQVLITICASGERLLAGNCAKGYPGDTSGIQAYSKLSDKARPGGQVHSPDEGRLRAGSLADGEGVSLSLNFRKSCQDMLDLNRCQARPGNSI